MSPTLPTKTDIKGSTKTMSRIFHLGRNVKEYEEKHEEIINQHLKAGDIRCVECLKLITVHSSYIRGIKESGQKIRIKVVWCRECECGYALLPDFLLHNKHYSGNEIESVIIDSSTAGSVKEIDSSASEVTVRRWIKQIGERIKRSVSVLKYIFGYANHAINEIAIIPGSLYSELEQVLDKAPVAINYSGNKLGLANLWLGTNQIVEYI